MSESLQCVSGLTFGAEPWRVEHLRMVLNKALQRQGKLFTKMLASVDQGLEDPGPYTDPAFVIGRPVPWDKVIVQDQLSAMVLVRIESDHEMELRPLCPECRQLVHPEGLQADLRQIKFEPVQEVLRQHLSTGDPMIFRFHRRERCALVGAGGLPLDPTPTGEFEVPVCPPMHQRKPVRVSNDPGEIVEIVARALYVVDQVRFRKLMAQSEDAVLELTLAVRTAEVRDPKLSQPLKGFVEIHDWIQKQSWPLRQAYDRWFDWIEGGPDMTIAADCQACNAPVSIDIPFDPRFFGMSG